MGDYSPHVESISGKPRPAVTPGATAAISLGNAMRRAREQRGLTLPQIASITKLPLRHLEALERGDFGFVPGGMYLRAEIRAYADAIGLSHDAAVEWLRAAAEQPPAIDLAPPPAVPAAVRPVSRKRATVAAVCVALTAIALWSATRDARAPSPDRLAVPQTTTASGDPVTASSTRSAAATPVRQTSQSSGVADDAVAATSGSGRPVLSPDNRAADAATAEPRTFDPQLDIVTDPAGARVTVDGVGWGSTPVSIRYLPPGRRRLRVTREGFATEERVIDFAANQQRTTVRFTLRPLE